MENWQECCKKIHVWWDIGFPFHLVRLVVAPCSYGLITKTLHCMPLEKEQMARQFSSAVCWLVGLLVGCKTCHALKKTMWLILHIRQARIVDTKIKLFTVKLVTMFLSIMKYRIFYLEFNLKIRYLCLILIMFRIGEWK